MSRVRRVGIDPSRPESVVDQVNELIFEIDGKLDFGEPLDPNDHDSVTLAGDMSVVPAHNGTRSNIWGSWVELVIDGSQGNAIGDPITCNHNLYLEQPGGYTTEPVAGEPNCRWFVAMWQHTGAEGTVYDDIRVSPTATKLAPGEFGPTYTKLVDVDGAGGSIGVYVEAFSEDRDEMVTFPVQIPHTYKQGTAIEAHVHWTPLVSGVGVEQVSWAMEYSWANRGDVFQNTSVIAGDVHVPAATPPIAHTHYVTELGDIGVTGDFSPGEVSSMLLCRLWRDEAQVHGTDTLDELAGLLEVDFHFQIDGHGSDDEDNKTADWELRDRPFNIMRLTGDNITANSIDLRIYASPFLLVDDKAPLKVTLFFIKATR